MHQGHFGECFIAVLAAAAGLQISKSVPDASGEDYELKSPSRGSRDFPRLEAQVKSWSRPRGSDNHWRYDGLTEKQFDSLAGGGFRVPRYLFLVIVPDAVDAYSDVDHECLRLNHAAYWASFADDERPTAPSADKRRPVEVPKDNLLDVKALWALLSSTEAEVR